MNGRRLLAVAAAAIAISACTRPRPITVTADVPFTLSPGKAARTADGVGVRYTALLEDSRCPQGAQCVWAGTVRVVVMLTDPSGSSHTDTLDLARKRRSMRLGPFVVRFVEFEPPPVRAGAPRTDPARTEATFIVQRDTP